MNRSLATFLRSMLGPRLFALTMPCAILAVAGLAFAPRAYAQEPADIPSELDHPSLDDLAIEAGTAAGLADVCNADPAPINSALRSLLHASYPDHARRHLIWVRYKTTESSTISLLAARTPPDCSQVAMVVQKEVLRLAE